MRTDDNTNPAAITTDVAHQGGLQYGLEYTLGTPFPGGSGLVTARLLGDPVALTIKVIDKIGYYTHMGTRRWEYIAIPRFIWMTLRFEEKRDVIGFHYQREGGIQMRGLFPNYGAI